MKPYILFVRFNNVFPSMHRSIKWFLTLKLSIKLCLAFLVSHVFTSNSVSSILRQWPTWCTLALFYNTSNTILYMFRALYAHHQEAELYWCSICYHPLRQWPSGTPVHRMVTDWENDTRCRINRIQPPDDKHVVLETFGGLYWKYFKIKKMCIKLVIV